MRAIGMGAFLLGLAAACGETSRDDAVLFSGNAGMSGGGVDAGGDNGGFPHAGTTMTTGGMVSKGGTPGVAGAVSLAGGAINEAGASSASGEAGQGGEGAGSDAGLIVIAGTVVDDYEQPIEGATVATHGRSSVTDAFGKFTLRVTPTYDLSRKKMPRSRGVSSSASSVRVLEQLIRLT